MNNELLPCPFCGGEVGFHKDEECDGCHYIECQSCKGMFDLSTKADPENNAETLENLNERIATVWNQRSQQSAPAGYRVVPVEPTRTMLHRAYDNNLMPWISRQSTGHDCAAGIWEAMLAAAPKAETVQEPVAWQFFDDGKWFNGYENPKDHRANTEAAGYPVRDLYAAPQPVAPEVKHD